jgi:hypothetical protein
MQHACRSEQSLMHSPDERRRMETRALAGHVGHQSQPWHTPCCQPTSLILDTDSLLTIFAISMQLPEFPSKKMFGSLSPALIKERQAALEKYMKAIAMDETVSRSNLFQIFHFLSNENTTTFCGFLHTYVPCFATTV